MLSEADTRTIDACREVLRDLATAAKAEADFGGLKFTAEVYSRGRFSALCNSADHALAHVLTEAATYLDSIHAEASLRQAGPRPLEP
jgi:hypothetical protein